VIRLCIEKRAANRNAVVNVNSNLMVSANNILLFLKKYQVNFEDLDIDEKLIVVKTDKINSPTPLTKKDGIHLGKLLSLAITKHILLDTYKECYQVVYESEIIQLHVEEEELLTLFVVKTDKINSPTPLTTTSAFNGVPL
jgi:hypothetical protein